MTQKNEFTTQPIHPSTLIKRMLLGAGIALILIIAFLASAGQPDPEWPKFWILKPLVVVPLAGAMGGLFYYYMDRILDQRGWKKIITIIVSLLVYLIGLWLGTVLGLNGTMWD